MNIKVSVALLTEFSNDRQQTMIDQSTVSNDSCGILILQNSRQLKLLHSFCMIDQMSCFVMPLHIIIHFGF